jgi:hypothetical protein
MKITICGSVAFQDKAIFIKKELEKLNHQVKMWPLEIKNQKEQFISAKEYYKIRKKAGNKNEWVWQKKAEAVMDHFNKVAWSEAILVLNYNKNKIKNYIGGNTLMEIGIAFYLKNKIFLLNQVPEISYKEEILGVRPIIINNDLSKIV